MNLVHKVNEFINDVLIKSEDEKLVAIGRTINDFKARHKINVFSAITTGKLISECV